MFKEEDFTTMRNLLSFAVEDLRGNADGHITIEAFTDAFRAVNMVQISLELKAKEFVELYG